MLLDTNGTFPYWTIRKTLVLYLLFGGVGFATQVYLRDNLDTPSLLYWALPYFLLSTGLAGSLIIQNQGIQDPAREIKLFVILLSFLIFLTIRENTRHSLKRTGIYLMGFTILFGIYLSHAAQLYPGSGLATYPILAGFMMGLNLFILPRYLSRNGFLWLFSLVSVAFVAMGIPAYAGSYSVGPFEAGLRDNTVSIPLTEIQFPVLESIFANPNTLGAVVFGGAFASFALAHRMYAARQDHLWILPTICVLLNTVGLFLSKTRSGYLALTVATIIYLAYIWQGRASVPFVTLFLIGFVALFLSSIYLNVLPINPSNRFELWQASVMAISDNPSLLGAGIVDTSELIAPYAEEPARGYFPHNSYLQIFLRSGLLGGTVYLAIVGGSILQGLVRYLHVDVSILALAVGYAVHQLFETYTMFNFSVYAMPATLVFGYLILDGTLPEDLNADTSKKRL